MNETLIPHEENSQKTIEPVKTEVVPMDMALKQTYEDARAQNPDLGGQWTPIAADLLKTQQEDIVTYQKDDEKRWQRVRGALKQKPLSDEELEQALPHGLNRTMVNTYYDDNRGSWMWQLRPSPELIDDEETRKKIETEIENWPAR